MFFLFQNRGGITGGNAAAGTAGEGYADGGVHLGGGGGSSDEEDEAPPALPDRELQIPVLPRPPPGADVMVSRLPNILGVKTEAFDPDTYDEDAVRVYVGLGGRLTKKLELLSVSTLVSVLTPVYNIEGYSWELLPRHVDIPGNGGGVKE